MEGDKEAKSHSYDTSESLTCEKDFIYVDDDGSDSSTEQKSLLSFDVCKKSEGSETSSYSEVQPVDFEPKMGAIEHGGDVSKLVEEAQLDDDINKLIEADKLVNEHVEETHLNDFLPNYYETSGNSSDLKINMPSPAALQTLSSVDSTASDEDDDSILTCRKSEGDDEDACVLFHNITYLGSSTIYAPVSDLELRRAISVLCDNTEVSIDIILAISLSPCGCIRLIEPSSRNDIATYNINSICYWGKGDHENREKDCLAFNISHGKEDPTFHCHVFKCGEEDNVSNIYFN